MTEEIANRILDTTAPAQKAGVGVNVGGTVIIALLSLWVAGIPLVASLGYRRRA